jgi:hypothetical protein
MKAYPFIHKHPTSGQTSMAEGKDLRDDFAGLAMQALLSDSDWRQDMDFNETATAAYRQADAMMKAREVKNDQP